MEYFQGPTSNSPEESTIWWQAYCVAIRAGNLPRKTIRGVSLSAEDIADAAVDAYEKRWGISGGRTSAQADATRASD
jgi:hypothetical protein